MHCYGHGFGFGKIKPGFSSDICCFHFQFLSMKHIHFSDLIRHASMSDTTHDYIELCNFFKLLFVLMSPCLCRVGFLCLYQC
jgi:hypothetical protein